MINLSYMIPHMKTDTQTHNIRSNRFNGESIQLTDEEAKKHDELFVAEMLATADESYMVTVQVDIGTLYVRISIGFVNIMAKLTWSC